ncbi:MSL2 protein [Operophtera brumata]|uniref:E3 ubiquitin-protein ligase MSL2 n=1 Tax=Operophtera brumata TaxID=104452 RepID=A0A0L7LPN1_OPEBR|nr:MSL2 protein [Operophtera brumata]
MNATSLYVSTCRLIILADAADKSSWIDLFRLVPYLRQSLSCTVCGNLLKEPYTPTSSGCQHHVCKKCKGGRKKLKPSCSWCKDYDKYAENLQLRILLQCYKKLCEYFMDTDVYKTLLEEDEITAGVNGGTVASSGLIDLIQEGAVFDDDYKSTAGLSKSAYSILPCVYTNSASTQTQVASTNSNSDARSSKDSPSSRTTNGSPMYSVMYAGSGNKITIKRKAMDDIDSPSHNESTSKDSKSNSFKKPSSRNRSSTGTKRKGCRCGNATATPGKLTCCGQRCPCYVESKPCTECKCKGCIDLTVVYPLVAVYTELRDAPPLLPPTILMDDDMIPEGSADDDTSSPQEYNAASPTEGDHSIEDDISSQSNDTQGEDANSDVEVDV